MAKDLLTLANEVNYTVGNDPALLATAKLWVDRAYQHITQAVEFPEAQATATTATVIGTNSYALPADFFSVYSMRDNTNQRILRQVLLPDFDDFDTSIQSRPDLYTLDQTNFYLWPTPDAVVTLQLRYRKQFSALSVDADTHDLPELWNEPIVLLASAYGFDYRNEIERARHYRSMSASFINTQEKRLQANLFDHNAPIAPIGLEIK